MAAPASTAEALEMVRDGLSYLAAADPTVLAARAQAECLQVLEQAEAIATAARARILAASAPRGAVLYRPRSGQRLEEVISGSDG